MMDVVSKEAIREHRAIPGVQMAKYGDCEIVYMENKEGVVIYEINSERKELSERVLKQMVKQEETVYIYAYGDKDTEVLGKLGFDIKAEYNSTDGRLFKRLMVRIGLTEKKSSDKITVS